MADERLVLRVPTNRRLPNDHDLNVGVDHPFDDNPYRATPTTPAPSDGDAVTTEGDPR